MLQRPAEPAGRSPDTIWCLLNNAIETTFRPMRPPVNGTMNGTPAKSWCRSPFSGGVGPRTQLPCASIETGCHSFHVARRDS